MRSQGEWIRNVVSTDGCTTCHQLGNRATREMPEALGTFADSVLAWDRRIQSGQAGGSMSSTFTRVGRQRALQMYADWTDRIAKGELPSATPPRPQGKERNVVITMWDWADPKVYLHDEIATDKRNPTSECQWAHLWCARSIRGLPSVVDPVHNTRQPGEADRARSENAQRRQHQASEAVAILGRRGNMAKPGKRPQLLDGQPGARLVAARVRQNQTMRVLPGRFKSSVREGLPDHSEWTSDRTL